MKNTMIAGAAAIALAAPAYAELEGDLSLTYSSQFNYRGVNGVLEDVASLAGLDTDDSFDAEINVSYALNDQWAVVAGANVDSVSGDALGNHNRYRAGVRYSAENYTLELGYQQQRISSLGIGLIAGITSIDTDEIYLNVGTTCPLTGGSLNLFVAHDSDALDGTYAELSLSKGWELTECLGLAVTAGISYSFDYWDNLGGTGNDWNHAYITVGLPWEATDNLTVTPFVTLSQGLDALDASDTAGFEEKGEVVYGVSASVSF